MKTLSNNSANPDINLANIINLIDVINTSLEQKILFSIDLNKGNNKKKDKKDNTKTKESSWDGWEVFDGWDGDIGGWDFN